MPKRTAGQMIAEINLLAEHIKWAVGYALRDVETIDMRFIGMAKRRAQELAVECQRLEDLMDGDIEEAVQQLRKGLDDE
jgi:hypothetical protein